MRHVVLLCMFGSLQTKCLRHAEDSGNRQEILHQLQAVVPPQSLRQTDVSVNHMHEISYLLTIIIVNACGESILFEVVTVKNVKMYHVLENRMCTKKENKMTLNWKNILSGQNVQVYTKHELFRAEYCKKICVQGPKCVWNECPLCISCLFETYEHILLQMNLMLLFFVE